MFNDANDKIMIAVCTGAVLISILIGALAVHWELTRREHFAEVCAEQGGKAAYDGFASVCLRPVR